MLALVAHITGLLSEMEGRIMNRLDANSQGAAERWRKHDEELAVNTKRVVERFVKIESVLDAHISEANAFFAKQHDEDVASDARVRPVRTTLAWVIEHWGSILLFLFGLLGFLAIAADVIARYLGGQS
jgi:hypothetical protein